MSLRFPKHTLGGLRTQPPPLERAERDRQRAAASGDTAEVRAQLLGLTGPQARLLRAMARGPRERPGRRVMALMDALTVRRSLDVHGAWGVDWAGEGFVALKPWGRYLLTDTGRRALAATMPADELMLKQGDGLTANPGDAVQEGGGTVDTGTLKAKWKQQAATNHAAAADPYTAARDAADRARRAA